MSTIARWRHRFNRWRNPLGAVCAEQWLADARRVSPSAIAIVNPEWRGIYSSTVNLFPVVLPLRDGLTHRGARAIVELLIGTGASRFVMSGLPPSYEHLVRPLQAAGASLYVLWHGSFMQSSANHEWQSFCLLKRLLREGLVHKVGFVKAGMADAFKRLELPATFVMNAIGQAPPAASTPEAGGPHLGIAAVKLNLWRKLPFAMLAACGDISGAVVHLAGADDRVIEFVEQMSLNARIQRGSIPQTEMPRWLASKHLNLYVTISECCPMLPLESLAVGVPCLLGPTSHLFEDDPYLHSRLVVPYPDRHEIIAQYIRTALRERDQIVAAYTHWLPGYLKQSQQSVRQFLDLRADDAASSWTNGPFARIDAAGQPQASCPIEPHFSQARGRIDSDR